MNYLEQRVAALEKAVKDLSRRLAPEEPAILKECRADMFRNGLQGGGSVRLTHLPTGIVMEGQAATGDVRDLARELAGDLEREVAAKEAKPNPVL